MATAMTLFDQGPLPAHVQRANEIANIVPRASINALLFEKGVWTISLDGKKTKLMKKDDDGEDQPVQIFTGVILDYTKQRGREYYSKPFDPASVSIPDCWSDDGVKPNDDVVIKQSATCAACPMSKKNSKMTEQGKGTVACSQFRKLALVPAAQIGSFPPLRLKIKITSDYDKTGAEANASGGWFAYQQYLEYLSSKGVRHTTVIPTKIKFDTSVTYAKLLFSPGRQFVPADIWTDVIAPLAASDEVRDLLAATYHPSGSAVGKPLPVDTEEEEEVTQQAAAKPAAATSKPKAAAAKAAPAPAPVVEEEEEGEDETVAVATAPAEEEEEEPVQTAEQIAAAKRQVAKDAAAKTTAGVVAKAGATAAKAKAAAQAAPAEEEGETIMPPPVKPKAASSAPKSTPTTAAINAPADVQTMLTNWDD